MWGMEQMKGGPIPSEVIERVAPHVISALNKAVQAPKDSDVQNQALADAISRLSDLLTIPEMQKYFVSGIVGGLRHAYDAARRDGQRASLTGSDLRKVRTAAGVSQTELARHIGQLQANVAHWERGTFPVPAKHIPAILDYFAR